MIWMVGILKVDVHESRVWIHAVEQSSWMVAEAEGLEESLGTEACLLSSVMAQAGVGTLLIGFISIRYALELYRGCLHFFP